MKRNREVTIVVDSLIESELINEGESHLESADVLPFLLFYLWYTC